MGDTVLFTGKTLSFGAQVLTVCGLILTRTLTLTLTLTLALTLTLTLTPTLSGSDPAQQTRGQGECAEG